MNRVQQAFANGKAFIPFITVVDPSLVITEHGRHPVRRPKDQGLRDHK